MERYQFIRKLGKGGTGEVYLAEDIRLGKLWAVKKIPKEKTLREGIHVWKDLSHPALVRAADLYADEEFTYLVMDYAEGETLASLREKRSFSEEEVTGIGIQLCGLLIYLHGLSPPVIWRDLKPSNIILDPRGRIHGIDFDTAVRLSSGFSGKTEYAAGMTYGTRGFAPPAQLRGAVGPQCDLYAAGATLRYLLGQDAGNDRKRPAAAQCGKRRSAGCGGRNDDGGYAGRVRAFGYCSDPAELPGSIKRKKARCGISRKYRAGRKLSLPGIIETAMGEAAFGGFKDAEEMKAALEKLQDISRSRNSRAGTLRLTAALLFLILFALVRNTAEAAQDARYAKALSDGAYEEMIALQPSEEENYLFALSAYEHAGRCGEGIRLVCMLLERNASELTAPKRERIRGRIGMLFLLGSAYDDSFAPSPKEAEQYLTGSWKCLARASWEFSDRIDWEETRFAYFKALAETAAGKEEPGGCRLPAPADRELREAFLARFAQTYEKELGQGDRHFDTSARN